MVHMPINSIVLLDTFSAPVSDVRPQSWPCLGLNAKIFGLGLEAQILVLDLGLATQGLGLVPSDLVNITD